MSTVIFAILIMLLALIPLLTALTASAIRIFLILALCEDKKNAVAALLGARWR